MSGREDSAPTPKGAGRPGQLGLFGPVDGPDEPKVRAAAVDPELRALGDALPDNVRLGTSSWSFAGWRGIVYAPNARQKHLARGGLEAYGKHPLLRTVGVDRTFYGPIPADEFAGYRAQVPADFRFLVKAWSELTSPTLPGRTGLNPRYLDPDAAVDHCIAPAVDGLGDRLGPLLLQFPPQGRDVTGQPERFADDLFRFLSALPEPHHYAVELRDERLFTDRYAAALRDAGCAHGYVVHPRMPSLADQLQRIPIAGPTSLRWMLHGGMRYEQAVERYQPFDAVVDPDPDSRRQIAAICRRAIELDVEMIVVVNNKAEGSSPLSVIELARELIASSAG